MKNILILSLMLLLSAFSISAQKTEKQKTEKLKTEKPKTADSKKTPATTNGEQTPFDTAKAAVAAHGGDKFKNMKTLIVRGTADISGSPTATFPASFFMVIAGEKYRLEIENPLRPFKQTFDGKQTRSSINNFMLPPINRLGLPLLQKIDSENFTVSALPEKYKKKKGFRVTSPEGYYTDFFTDEKTGRIKSYEASYEYNGRTVTTSVEIDKLLDVKGVIVPERYAQRFDLGQFTVYSNFKAKEILVDTEVEDDVFSLM